MEAKRGREIVRPASYLRILEGFTLQELCADAVDTHCHLDFIQSRLQYGFDNWQGLKETLKVDNDTKMGGVITNFCDPRDWDYVTRVQPSLMEQIQYESEVFYTIGCHPHWSDRFGESGIEVMENIVKMDRFGKCVAIGECGLDRSKNNKVSIKIQKEVFRAQVELAMRLDLPLVLHVRDAQKEALDILLDMDVPTNYRIHRHCFTEDWEACRKWIGKFPNSVFGFTNLITKPSMEKLRSVVKHLDLNRIILETDAPYFVPQSLYTCPVLPPPLYGEHRDKAITHPFHVIAVAAKVAQVKNLSLQKIFAANTSNVERIYGIKFKK